MVATRDDREQCERALRDAGGRRAQCPLCVRARGRPDTKRSLASFADGGWYCFRCGVRGKADVSGWTATEDADATSVITPPDGFVELANDDSLTHADARRYLYSRVARATAERVRVGATARGYWCGRLIFPMLAFDGTWVGFVARDWTGIAQRSYLYPKGMRRSSMLYGLDDARMHCDAAHPLIVVEGVIDALHLHPYAVACLGKPTHAQTEILRTLDVPVVFALDGDAWQEAWSWAQRFRFDGVQAGYLRLPPGVDPDELDPRMVIADARESINARL